MKPFIRVTWVLLILMASTSFVLAQPKANARWTSALSKNAPSVGEEIELVLTAPLDAGWIIYSSDFQAEIGPQPTRLLLRPHDSYALVGSPVSVGAKRKQDKTWDIELGYFEKHAELRQKIRILKKDFVIAGEVKGQLCSETDGTCELFGESFSLTAH